jgi:hypothetical protein
MAARKLRRKPRQRGRALSPARTQSKILRSAAVSELVRLWCVKRPAVALPTEGDKRLPTFLHSPHRPSVVVLARA